MITLSCILKNENSFERFLLEYEDKDIKWMNISNLEGLQEEISINEFDLVIVDKRIWWIEECEELLRIKNSNIIYFNGDFANVFKKMDEEIKQLEEDEKQEELINKEKDVKSRESSNNVQIIVKEVIKEVQVEKIIYKSKDIRRNIFAVITDDDISFRDFYSLNLGAYLSSFKNSKSIVIDITFIQNIINYIPIESTKKNEIDKNVNAASILKCMDTLNLEQDVRLLRLNNEIISKALIKNIVFALRDFENIIFVVDKDNKTIPINYILALVNEIHLIIDPLYPSVKNSFKTIEFLKDIGQVNENIKIILDERVEDLDVWKGLYKDCYSLYELSKSEAIENINESIIFKSKRSVEQFKSILNIQSSKKFFNFNKRGR